MKLYVDYEFASVSMSSDGDFIKALEDLFERNAISHILESGTFLGLGSTKLLAETIVRLKKPPPVFYTIEVDLALYKKACKNVAKYNFIKPLWGLSVRSEDAVAYIKTDEAIRHHERYEDVYIDDIKDPVTFYLNEINGHLSKLYYKKNRLIQFFKNLVETKNPIFEENLFAKIIPEIKYTKPLILLDSAGGLGYLEFKTICSLMEEKPFFLILDDVHHLKHFRSYNDIATNGNFTILAENKKHGWVIAKYL